VGRKGDVVVMAQTGVIQVPHVRWGGRWSTELKKLSGPVGSEFQELAEYKKTTAYQVARQLNLGAALPKLPDGQRYEFGAREESDGTSTLLVRIVEEA
jgi:hypothetical protein